MGSRGDQSKMLNKCLFNRQPNWWSDVAFLIVIGRYSWFVVLLHEKREHWAAVTAKTKIMTVGNWKSIGIKKVGSKEIEECHEFCYLGSITHDGGCDRVILVRLGKTNSTFGRLGRMWASRKISKGQAVQLTSYDSVTLWSRDLANDKINDARSWKQLITGGSGRSYTFSGKIR